MLSLRPIRFHEVNDVYAFTQLLEANNILSITGGEDKKNLKQIQVNADLLAQHFLVASDGNTYLLEDIQQLSEEEAVIIQVYFSTKDGKNRLTLAQVKKMIDKKEIAELSKLIHNKPLAEALSKLDPTPGRLLKVPEFNCAILKYATVFPVLTPEEDSFEYYAIRDYVEKRCRHPITNQALSPEQLLPNHALQDLINVNFQQRQNRKQELINKKGKDFTTAIQALESEKKDLQRCLEVQRDYWIQEKSKYETGKEKYEEALKKHPELGQKTITELNKLGETYQEKKLHLTRVDRLAYGSCLGIGAVGGAIGGAILGCIIGGPIIGAALALVGFATGGFILGYLFCAPLSLFIFSPKIAKVEQALTHVDQVKSYLQNENKIEFCNEKIKDIDGQLQKIASSDSSSMTKKKMVRQKKKNRGEEPSEKTPLLQAEKNRRATLFSPRTGTSTNATNEQTVPGLTPYLVYGATQP